MSLIQLLLVLASLGLLFIYFTFFRSVLIDRVVAVTLFLISLVVIVFPDYTTLIANAVGVGRGTDLFLYLFATLALFAALVLYSRIERLERMHTELIRMLAVKNPEQVPRAGSSD